MPVYEVEVAGGVEVGGAIEVTTNRTVVIPDLTPLQQTISDGGVVVGGSVTPVFVTPGTYVAEVAGGIEAGGSFVVIRRVTPPTFAPPARGGINIGGAPRAVFVSPSGSVLDGSLFVATVYGGVLVGGTPATVAVAPNVFLVVVSGGIKVAGHFISGLATTTPSSTGISLLSTRGGLEVGGITWPVFITPTVYRVPVDPRILASISIGGGGGAVFITPQAYVQQVEGDIIVASESELGQDETYETWALNGKNNEPAVFSGFRFNSFAIHNEVPYAAGDGGLFSLRGDSDDGALIHPGVRFGPLNFGLDCQKRIRVVNIGQAGSQAKVRVEVVDGGDRVFTPKRDPRRVPIDRDLQGEDFFIEISDFKKLSHVEIIPLILFRK